MTQLNSPSSGGIEQTAQSSPTIYDAFQTRDVCESNDFDSPQSDGSTLKIDSKATKRRTDSPDASQSYETIDKLDFVQFGGSRGVQERIRKIYSTTSSVYAEHTISNPNTEQLLFCMSTVIQSQIFEDMSASVERKALQPVFNFSPSLPPESGGHRDFISRDILQRESENDEELQKHLIAGNVPTVDTIYSYLSLLKEQSRYPTECNIIALIYTNRMTSMGSMPLTMLNWRAIWAVSVILAQKMWDDTPLKTSAFVHILPSFSKQLLRHLELSALTILQFSTGVKPSLYAQYYFELRTLFFEIHGGPASVNGWTLKPLSVIKARRLEDRSSNVWDKAKPKSSKSDPDKHVRSSNSSTNSMQFDDDASSSSPKMKERSKFLGMEGTPVSVCRSASKSISSAGTPATSNGSRKGWQTSSPAHSNAHDRLLMMDQYEESKGKNFNPYVFRERYHNVTLDRGPDKESKSPFFQKNQESRSECTDAKYVESDEFAGTVLHSITTGDDAAEADDLTDRSKQDGKSGEVHYSSVSPPNTVTADRYVFWESVGHTNGTGERFIRTYEDVTLTDTSRYVIS